MNENPLKEAVVQARHDLRNPVSHILGFSEMILPGAEGEFRVMLEEISRSGNAIVALINKYLNWPHPGNVAELQTHLSDPAYRILALAHTALSQPHLEKEVAEDVLRIAEAAKELLCLAETVLPTLRLLFDQQPLAQDHLQPCSADCQSAVSPVANRQPVPTSSGSPAIHNTGSAPPTARARPSVLVVDDLQEIRRLLETRLTELGYTVYLAASGPEALSLLNTTPVDLILLDIAMPAMDGIEVLRQLKAGEKTNHIPVLMLTFSESPETVALCLKLGAANSISKPFSHASLLARLEATLASLL